MQLLAIVTVGYIIGIIGGLYLKCNIVPIIFLLVGIFIFFSKIKSRLLKVRYYFILFMCAMFFSNVQILYLENKFENLYKDLEEINVVGIVTSSPKYGNYKTSYVIKVQSINGDKKYKGTYLNLYVKGEDELDYGSKICFIGNYSKPAYGTNYKAFDYAEYLKAKCIYGNVNLDRNLKIFNQSCLNPILILSNNIKNKIEKNLNEILGDNSRIVKRNYTWRYI